MDSSSNRGQNLCPLATAVIMPRYGSLININPSGWRMFGRGLLPKSSVVTLFRLLHQSFLLEGICQVTVGIRKVGLKFDGPPVCVNSEVDKTEKDRNEPSVRVRKTVNKI